MSGTNIKAIIDAAVTTNANEENTGARVNNAMNDMVDVLLNYEFGGVISDPSNVNEDDTDLKWWYIAYIDGVYTYYGGITIDHEFAIITYNGAFTKHSFGNNYLPTFPDDDSLVLLGDGTFGAKSATVYAFSLTSTDQNSEYKVIITHSLGSNNIDLVLYKDNGYRLYNIAYIKDSINQITISFNSEITGTVTGYVSAIE